LSGPVKLRITADNAMARNTQNARILATFYLNGIG
jgi:hypothetical protein